MEVGGLPVKDSDRKEILESPLELLGAESEWLVLWRQSKTTPPNAFVRNLKTGREVQLTSYTHPQPELLGVSKQMITYKRETDGLDLS